MPHARLPALCFLSAFAWGIPAAGQNSQDQFRPELGIYVQQGESIRLEFIVSPRFNWTTDDWQGYFDTFVEAALKPVFRRELRDDPDVYRNRYLTFRAGYRRRNGLSNGDATSENRFIMEVTSKYHLPWQFVIVDRNRGEFRWVKGQDFSERYRNRLWLERDLSYGWLRVTPFVSDEIFYDARVHRWTSNQYSFGFDLPVHRRVVFEPYYLRQNGSSSPPSHINAIGLKCNLYF
jgi:Protein of unknown function (DUF2490)